VGRLEQEPGPVVLSSKGMIWGLDADAVNVPENSISGNYPFQPLFFTQSQTFKI
jgi:hypothetical protein